MLNYCLEITLSSNRWFALWIISRGRIGKCYRIRSNFESVNFSTIPNIQVKYWVSKFHSGPMDTHHRTTPLSAFWSTHWWDPSRSKQGNIENPLSQPLVKAQHQPVPTNECEGVHSQGSISSLFRPCLASSVNRQVDTGFVPVSFHWVSKEQECSSLTQ